MAYFAILTTIGEAKIANAQALGESVQITQMAVGDGNGAATVPNPAQTTLVNERRRAALNSLSVDPLNPAQIIAEQVIPENVGGYWIRELGLYDADGDLIAVANCPDTYKPQLSEGSGRTQVIRMVLVVSSTAAVTLKIDPAVVLATRGYVDAHKIRTDNPHAVTKAQVGLGNVDNLSAAQIAATVIARLRGIPLPIPTLTAPIGMIAYNGAEVLIADYPELWAWAQANSRVVTDAEWSNDNWGCFSSGNGTTTFRVPDLRAEFIRGFDDGRGKDSGRAFGSAQTDAFKSHSHPSPGGVSQYVGFNPSGPDAIGGGSGDYVTFNNTGNAGGTETRPTNVAYPYYAFY